MNKLAFYLVELRELLEEKSESAALNGLAKNTGLTVGAREEKAGDVVTLNITGKANPPSPASIRCETGGEAEEINLIGPFLQNFGDTLNADNAGVGYLSAGNLAQP